MYLIVKDKRKNNQELVKSEEIFPSLNHGWKQPKTCP